MAGALAGTLLIDIATNVASLKAGFDQAGNVVKGFGESVSKIGNLIKGALGFVGFEQAIHQTLSLMEAVGDLQDKAQSLALTTDELQAFSAAMADAGVKSEQSGVLLGKAAKYVGDALQGSKESIEFFKGLKVGLVDSAGSADSMANIMQRTAQAILAVEDPMKRVSLASQFMGKSGRDAIPALEALARGSRELKDVYADQIIPPDVIKRFDDIGDALNRAKAAARAQAAIVLGDIITDGVVAAVIDAATAFKAMGESLAELKRQTADTSTTGGALSKLGDAQSMIQSTKKELDLIDKGIQAATPYVRDFVNAWGDFLGAIGAVADDVKNKLNPALQGTTEQLAAQQAVLDKLDREKLNRMIGGVPSVPPSPTTGNMQFGPFLPPGGFTNLPTPKHEGVDKYAEALKRLNLELKATEEGQAAFNRAIAAGKPTAEAEREAKLFADIAKKQGDIVKDIPAGVDTKPLEELAEKVVRAAAAYEDLKRVQKEADDVVREFGDGTKELAERMAVLNDLLQKNKITVEQYNAAVKGAQEQQKDQKQKLDETKEGWDGFSAGMEAALRNIERQTSAFAMGAELVTGTFQLMSAAISEFVQKGTIDFQKLAASFAAMLADMTAKWIAAQIIKAGLNALGIGLGGVGGATAAGSGSLFSAPAPSGGMMAAGGDVFPGRSYVVGERGPETFVPAIPGRITPNAANNNSAVIVNVDMGSTQGAADPSSALQFGRKVKAAVIDVIANEKRPGGTLYLGARS